MERIRTREGDDRRPQNSRTTQSSLDPWNGDRISEIHKSPSTASKVIDLVKVASYTSDHPHRPQRVNEQIKIFNAKLDLITRDQDTLRALNHLQPGQQVIFRNYVRDISISFAKYSLEAIKDYGENSSQFSRERRQRASKELEKLNDILTEMYDDLNKVKKIWLDLHKIAEYKIYLTQKERNIIDRNMELSINSFNGVFSEILEVHHEYNTLSIDENKQSRLAVWQKLEPPTRWINETLHYGDHLVRYFTRLGSPNWQTHLSTSRLFPTLNSGAHCPRDTQRDESKQTMRRLTTIV